MPIPRKKRSVGTPIFEEILLESTEHIRRIETISSIYSKEWFKVSALLMICYNLQEFKGAHFFVI
jgi:hypothetical protein